MAEDISEQYADEAAATPNPIFVEGQQLVSLAEPTPPNAKLPEETVSEVPRDPATGRFLKKSHPEYLSRRAVDLGFSQQEIDSTSTSDLRDMVRYAFEDKLAMQRAADFETALTQSRAAAVPVADPAEPSAGLSLPDDQFAPELIKVLRSQQDTIRRLETRLNQVETSTKSHANETLAQRVDRAFDALKNDPRYGVGRPPDDSTEMSRRKAVLGEAKRLAGPKANLEQICAKLRQADLSVFDGLQNASPVSAPISTINGAAQSTERWQNAAVAKPTHREGAVEAKGFQRAVQSVEAYLREKSLRTESDQPTTEDEFLG